MAELSWIHLVLFMILLLQMEATSEQYSYISVRPGANVTLPCYNVVNQDKCGKTNWTFSVLKKNIEQLVTLVDIKRKDRLSITEICSLDIKNVMREDVGLYRCSQQDQDQMGLVYLSIVNMTLHNAGNNVTVNCSVLPFGKCEHKVKWLLEDVSLESRHDNCSASVSFPNTTTLDSLTCEVTQPNGVVLNFPFRPQAPKGKTAWWWLVAVGLAALIVTVVVVVVRRHKTRKGEEQTEPDNVEPEDGVSYAAITFKKPSGSEAKVQVPGEADGDAVTYSTLGSASSAAAASADAGILYASVNRPSRAV